MFFHSSTANRHFLRSMARIGGGCSEFFDTQKKSQWQTKVKEQLSRAFQPALTDVRVEWWQFDDNALKPVQVRKRVEEKELMRKEGVTTVLVGEKHG